MNPCVSVLQRSSLRRRSSLLILAASVLASAPLFAGPAADGYYWQAMNSGVTRALHQISVVDKNFAVAAGTHGTLLVFSGGEWAPLPGWSSNNPYAVNSSELYATAISPTNVWVGAYGSTYNTLSKWDGEDFSTRTVTGARTRYMANVDGILLAARGENYVSISTNSMASTPTFTNVKLPNAAAGQGQVVISVAGSSATNLWAANPYETFRSINSGTTWTNMGAPVLTGSESLRAMAVSSNDTTWLGTSEGRVFSWTESNEFSSALFDFDFYIRDIYARDDQNVWFAGDGGNLYYYNGTTASKIDLGTTSAFYSITGTDENVWIAGANGSIYQAIPEPSTAAIAMVGACCFAGYRYLRLK